MAGWVELSLRVPAPACATIEALFESAGAIAITQDRGDGDRFAEPGLGPAAPWTHSTVMGLFETRVDLTAVERQVRAALGPDIVLARKRVPEQAWHEVWKQSWQPQLHAGGLCVCPTWCTPPPQATRVIWLDPGGAFGTGTHETTALCLDWLAGAHGLRGASVLDFGCGSGILAIAAALLGAVRVSAVDIDPEAVAVARANVALNRVEDRIALGQPDSASGAHDILLANILLEPLLALAPRFAGLLADGGSLVLSGLLVNQVPRVLEAYAAGFTMAAAVTRGDWALVAGHKRALTGTRQELPATC